MRDQDLFARITQNPEVLGGKPVISGTRLSVEYVVGLLKHGATVREVMAEYNGLREEDIQACLLLARQGGR